MTNATVLITDLDNTLFDWFVQWHSSFSVLIERVHAISGIPVDQLLEDARDVHQRFHTSEYSMLLEEMSCLRANYRVGEISEVFDEAIHAHRSARKRTLKLYDGVLDTMLELKRIGAQVVGYTESMAFYSAFRIQRLGLDGVIDYLYSPQDHEFPDGVRAEDLRTLPAESYGLKETIHRHTPKGELKPNPKLLQDIMNDVRAPLDSTVYVGDSPWKDIMMALDAGVVCGLAEYGRADHHVEYNLLKQVTHWSDEDVAKEKEISQLYQTRKKELAPNFVLRESFSELLDHVSFQRHERGRYV